MAKKESRYYAATITHLSQDDTEWQEIITRANLKALEALCANILTLDDDMDTIICAEIHDCTYSKEEAKQLQLIYLR